MRKFNGDPQRFQLKRFGLRILHIRRVTDSVSSVYLIVNTNINCRELLKHSFWNSFFKFKHQKNVLAHNYVNSEEKLDIFTCKLSDIKGLLSVECC